MIFSHALRTSWSFAKQNVSDNSCRINIDKFSTLGEALWMISLCVRENHETKHPILIGPDVPHSSCTSSLDDDRCVKSIQIPHFLFSKQEFQTAWPQSSLASSQTWWHMKVLSTNFEQKMTKSHKISFKKHKMSHHQSSHCRCPLLHGDMNLRLSAGRCWKQSR